MQQQIVALRVKKKPKKRPTECLDIDEVEAILRTCDRRTLQGRRDYAVLLLLVSAGLRKAEICAAKMQDVSTYRNQPVLEVVGKNNKYRRIPLSAKAVQAIKDYWNALKVDATEDSPLFWTMGKYGKYERVPLTPAAVDLLVKKAARKGLLRKRTSAHTLRHTFCTGLLYSGTDVKTAQELMGHAFVSTTQVYLHTTDERKREAVNRLPF